MSEESYSYVSRRSHYQVLLGGIVRLLLLGLHTSLHHALRAGYASYAHALRYCCISLGLHLFCLQPNLESWGWGKSTKEKNLCSSNFPHIPLTCPLSKWINEWGWGIAARLSKLHNSRLCDLRQIAKPLCVSVSLSEKCGLIILPTSWGCCENWMHEYMKSTFNRGWDAIDRWTERWYIDF